MVYTVSITSQGQISIPASVRRAIGLSLYDKALLTVQGNRVVIEPKKDLLKMKGFLKTNKKPLSSKELHERFAQDLAESVVS